MSIVIAVRMHTCMCVRVRTHNTISCSQTIFGYPLTYRKKGIVAKHSIDKGKTSTMQYIRTCVLCDEKIKSQHKLCRIHFRDYSDQVNEPWFIEIARQQKRQDDIDRRERFQLPFYSETDLHGEYKAPELLSKRDVGRPSTDWRIVEKVLKIYDESMEQVELGNTLRVKSLRQIAREVQQCMGVHIGYVTARNILLEYRKSVYMKPKTIMS